MKYDITGAGQSATMESTGAYSNVYEHWKRGHWYELPLLTYWSMLDEPDVFIDVGAHVGNHTVWAAKAWPYASRFAFEPNPAVFPVLERNAYGFFVECFDVAIAGGTGAGFLSSIGTDEGMHALRPHTDGDVAVATYSLDSLFPEVFRQSVIIKIDAESDNEPILRGATRLLTDNHCRLFIECATEVDHAATGAVLEDLGYRWTGLVWGATPMYEAVKA